MEQEENYQPKEIETGKLSFIFILYIFLLCMLMGVFISRIVSQHKRDAIWEQYEKDMNKLHKNFNN